MNRAAHAIPVINSNGTQLIPNSSRFCFQLAIKNKTFPADLDHDRQYFICCLRGQKSASLRFFWQQTKTLTEWYEIEKLVQLPPKILLFGSTFGARKFCTLAGWEHKEFWPKRPEYGCSLSTSVRQMIQKMDVKEKKKPPRNWNRFGLCRQWLCWQETGEMMDCAPTGSDGSVVFCSFTQVPAIRELCVPLIRCRENISIWQEGWS